MLLKRLEIAGFKSFARKTGFEFGSALTAIVGPNGSGKSNVVEAFRWVLGEQSARQIRAKKGEDFIFHGTTGAAKLAHASVALHLNNTSRFLNCNFDEVIITRHVYRDGVNEYYLNGSRVRLKDIIELIGGAGLGTSQHHIISQGEADRLLHASSVERKEIVADAMGLSIIELKKDESTRKLAKLEENLKQVELLQKEIAPHLKYLEKQVAHYHKIAADKQELSAIFKKYLTNERGEIKRRLTAVDQKLDSAISEKTRIEDSRTRIAQVGDVRQSSVYKLVLEKLRTGEYSLGLIASERMDFARQVGKLEGVIEEKQKQLGKVAPVLTHETDRKVSVPLSSLQSLSSLKNHLLSEIANITDIELLRARVHELINNVSGLVDRVSLNQSHAAPEHQSKTEELSHELDARIFELELARSRMVEREAKEKDLASEVKKIREEEARLIKESEQGSAKVYEFDLAIERAKREIDMLEAEKRLLNNREHELGQLVYDVAYLLQENLREEENVANEAFQYSESEQADYFKKIQRMRARIEEFGVGDKAVVAEYESTKTRDEYLKSEITDLAKGAEALKTVMKELETRLETQFATGLQRINESFSSYVDLLFGGGNAKLNFVEMSKRRRKIKDELELGPEPEVPEKADVGIDIEIHLPKKKVRSLDLLSGGERTLVSLALLFAVTEVNPPPFLILDETDAALDESNAKKFGDMLETLAKKTQLVIVTHNRETMAHAGVLYGVTLGADGTSRVLSIKLEQAEAVVGTHGDST